MSAPRLDIFREALDGLREVFAHPAYLGLAALIGLAAFVAQLWLPNYRLLGAVFATQQAAFAVKMELLWSLLGGLFTNFDAVAAFSAVVVPLLFGMDIAMIIFFLRRRRAQLPRGEIAAGVGGAASGAIAAGCAACGSFLLITLLSFFGATGALALLPLHGGELGLLSIALLLLSIVLIARKIAAPVVCEIALPGARGMHKEGT